MTKKLTAVQLKRLFVYLARNMLAFLSLVPFWLLFKATQPWRSNQTFKGITIVHLASAHTEPKESFALIVAALHLIERLDPRRFRRLQSEIRFVISLRLPSSRAKYQRIGRSCLLDLSRFWSPDSRRLSVGAVACVLVHEMTHARIESWFIPCTRRTRARIEKLCANESARFARHMDFSELKPQCEFDR